MKYLVNWVQIEGKWVVFVDDSLVCGIMFVKIVQMICEVGVCEVYFWFVSLLIKYFDYYGIDIFVCEKFLVVKYGFEEMCNYIGVDSFVFLFVDGIYCVMGYEG